MSQLPHRFKNDEIEKRSSAPHRKLPLSPQVRSKAPSKLPVPPPGMSPNRRSRKLPTLPGKSESKDDKNNIIVWGCTVGKDDINQKEGFLISIGSHTTMFLDENFIEVEGGKNQKISLHSKKMFEGGMNEAIKFLPRDISNKVVKKIDSTLFYQARLKEATQSSPILSGHNKRNLPPLPPSMKKRIPPPRKTPPPRNTNTPMKPPPEIIKEDKNIENYNEILRKAKTLNFKDLERMKIIRTDIGRDKLNRPVVLFKEGLFTREQTDRLLPFVLSKLDPIASQEYVLVWCIHNKRKGRFAYNEKNSYRPGLQWLLNVYKSLSRKVRKNLKLLYLVHPTLLYNIIIKFFRPFVSKKFWKKLTLCSNVRELNKSGVLPLPQCPLPPYVACYNIEKYKEKPPSQPLFGSSLREVRMRRKDQFPNNDSHIPLFLEKCFLYLITPDELTGIIPIRKEGIFRIAGNKAILTDVQTALNYGYFIDYGHINAHEVSGLVKIFFRQLTEPIIPYHHYDNFLNFFEQKKKQQQTTTTTTNENNNNQEEKEEEEEESFEEMRIRLKILLEKIPESNLHLLKRLILFLLEVSKFYEENKMGTSNLAILFGPNILRDASRNRMKMLQDSSKIMRITQFIIETSRWIFLGEEDSTTSGESESESEESESEEDGEEEEEEEEVVVVNEESKKKEEEEKEEELKKE